MRLLDHTPVSTSGVLLTVEGREVCIEGGMALAAGRRMPGPI
jgi:hypothetical protein